MYDGGAIMDVIVDASKMLKFDYIVTVASVDPRGVTVK